MRKECPRCHTYHISKTEVHQGKGGGIIEHICMERQYE